VTVAPPPVCDRCGRTLVREPLLIFSPAADLYCSSCAEDQGVLSRADSVALTTFGADWWSDLFPRRAAELAEHYLYRQPFYGPLYARFAEELDRGKEDIALSARYVQILLRDCDDPDASLAAILRGEFKVEPVRTPLATCSICGALASELSRHDCKGWPYWLWRNHHRRSAIDFGKPIDSREQPATTIWRRASTFRRRHRPVEWWSSSAGLGLEGARHALELVPERSPDRHGHGVSLFHREGWHGRSYHGEWANRAVGHFYATLVAAWSGAGGLYESGSDARTRARTEYLDTLYPGFESYRAEVRQRGRYGYTLVAWEWAADDDQNPRRDGDDEAGFTATDNVPLSPDHGFYSNAGDWSDPADEILSRAGVAAIWERLNPRERKFVVLASAGLENSEIDAWLGRQPGWARQTRRRLAQKLGRRRRESLRAAELIVDAAARRWADADLRPEATFMLEPGHGRAACGVRGPDLRLRQPERKPPEGPVTGAVRCECSATAESFVELDTHACPLPGWRQWSRAFRRHYSTRSRPGRQRIGRRRELRALGYEPLTESDLDRRDKFVVTFSPKTVS
jgi:hypothetical protein